MVYTVLLDLVSVSSNILSLICLYLFGADTLANVSCNMFHILVAPLREVTGGIAYFSFSLEVPYAVSCEIMLLVMNLKKWSTLSSLRKNL